MAPCWSWFFNPRPSQERLHILMYIFATRNNSPPLWDFLARFRGNRPRCSPVSYTDLWLLGEINAQNPQDVPRTTPPPLQGGDWEGVAFACWYLWLKTGRWKTNDEDHSRPLMVREPWLATSLGSSISNNKKHIKIIWI